MNFLGFLNSIVVTKKYAIGIALFIGLTSFITQAVDVSLITKYPIIKEWTFNLDFALLVILILIFVLESISMLIKDKIKKLSIFIGFLLKIANKIIVLAFSIFYLVPIKFLLRPIIKSVIDESLNFNISGVPFQFTKTLSERNDDHYYDKVVSVKNLKILVKPAGLNPRWRFGVKFSTNDKFTESRFDEVNNFLFHLTKDAEKNVLEYNLYQQGNNQRKLLINNFVDDPVILKTTTSRNETKITILNKFQTELLNLTLPKQKSAQLFAWADGQPYTLDAIISEK